MKITYLYHSGFSIELEHHVLLFDYYKGKLPKWEPDKKILVFVSHKHQDHFQMKIFDLISQYKNIHFFLGSDIRLSDAYLLRKGIKPSVKEVITNAGKNTVFSYEDVQIETLRSTDAGVAFLVQAEGKSFYHAGDLNWWYWKEESRAWNTQMEKAYKQEISHIEGRHFDAAFVPLDPRLEEGAYLGLRYFLEHTDADRIFPMHLWDNYEIIDRFRKTVDEKTAGKIIPITAPGMEFLDGR